MTPEFLNWLRVACINGVACSVDGSMAMVCNYRHIRTLRMILIWTALITFFHEVIGCLAAYVTFEARQYFICLVIARIVGILATGRFAWQAVDEALEPDGGMKKMSWSEVIWQTAILGSVDAGTFSHAGVVHLTAFGFWGIMANWTLSAVIVGCFTFGAGLFAAKGGTSLQKNGPMFLIIGAVLRVGLFFGLLILLLISLAENLQWIHLPHMLKISIEVLAVVVIAAFCYPYARQAQLRRLQEEQSRKQREEEHAEQDAGDLDTVVPPSNGVLPGVCSVDERQPTRCLNCLNCVATTSEDEDCSQGPSSVQLTSLNEVQE